MSLIHDPAHVRAQAATDELRRRSGVDSIDAALTLGSGWGDAADRLGSVVFDERADELPGFRAPVLAGHGGTLRVVQSAGGSRILIIGARTHLYEGHGADATAHGVRVAAAWGASRLVLTNGAGSVRADWAPGTPVVIADHINLTGVSPLNGPAFVDMSDAYSSRLRALVHQVDPGLQEGVYAQFRGPQYETPAEIRMARTLGADLIGMSTVVETIAARAAGLEVLAMSLVTNLAAGIQQGELSHAEVVAVGEQSRERLGTLLADIVARLDGEDPTPSIT